MTDEFTDWMMKPKLFEGTLTAGDTSLDVNFNAGIDFSGTLKLDFHPIAVEPESIFLEDKFELDRTKFFNFTLTGKSEDGTEFSSPNVIFTSLGQKSDFESGFFTMEPKASANRSALKIFGEAFKKPILKWRLRSFLTFHALVIETRLGLISMNGPYESPERDSVSGDLKIVATDGTDDPKVWRVSATKLFDHVCHIMSFAAGVQISYPISEFFNDETCEIELLTQKYQPNSSLPIFHPLSQNEIFICAVRSFFSPIIDVKNLFFAIKWFNMRGRYTEANLITSMTVLENLIDSNLHENDTLLISEDQFNALRKCLSNEIKKHSRTWTEEKDLQKIYIKELNERLTDLKRRSLLSKLQILAARWGVKIDDIPIEKIKEAKRARDQVVHRGHHTPKQGSTLDLHDHFLTIREIVVRFILTILQFEGQYTVYIGGYAQKKFEKLPIPAVE